MIDDFQAELDEINKMFETKKIYIKIPIYGLINRAKNKDKVTVNCEIEKEQIENLIGEFDKNTEYRFISVKGGFSSYGFIDYIAQKEIIEQLYVCSLAVGKRQIEELDKLYKNGRLKNAKFILGVIFKERGLADKYNYYDRFIEICEKNKWEYITTNNHAKLILIKTKNNYYVLETSSNLNENPKIEQFCFQENENIYKFYEEFIKGV